MNEKIKGYITYKEASEILGIISGRTAGRSAIAAQNIEFIKANKNTNYYHKDSIIKLANKVSEFFEIYCTPDEYDLSACFVLNGGASLQMRTILKLRIS